ncbi:MAG: hypothetical protein FH749_09975 [Firmicutes bacterium]|nr:hypothetical protein [Bacillota bacterium]
MAWVMFGEDRNETQKLLELSGLSRGQLGYITQAHEFLNDTVCWGRHPDSKDLEEMLSVHVPRFKSMATQSYYEPLTRDLEAFIALAEQGLSRERWVVMHRIVHDIDYFLLGRRGFNPDNWEASLAVEKLK